MRLLLILIISIAGGASLKAQSWETDFDKARHLATQENRKIILVFQGSDWCAPCIKLEKEVWRTKEFQEYARKNFVMLQADFPKKKKNKLPSDQEAHNRKLAERYNRNGHFPYVVVMDKNGKVMGSTGYMKLSPAEYIELLESFKS